MKTLTQRDHDIAQALQAKDAAYLAGDMDSCLVHHQRAKELGSLPDGHEATQYECPCGTRFTGRVLVLCYVSMYTMDTSDDPTSIEWNLMTTRGYEHHVTFCPECAAKLLAHHSKRDVVPVISTGAEADAGLLESLAVIPEEGD